VAQRKKPQLKQLLLLKLLLKHLSLKHLLQMLLPQQKHQLLSNT